jgi:NhaC family Na+:H+ antiporter
LLSFLATGDNMEQEQKPSLALSFIPVVVLLGLLIVNIVIYKDDATGGANQLALLISAGVATFIGIFIQKINYKELEEHVLNSIQMAMQANVILLVVGALIGLWILAGIVPAMIYYGLKLINPSIFLPVSCIVCAIVAVSTGSSWSTTGTVGIALIGIGKTLGIPEGMVAGAIISGAYFGDKMSPLSDTTNLAPAMAGTDLFTHIRHMMYTTVPAIIIAIIGFTILGFFHGQGEISTQNMQEVFTVIESNFNIGVHLFIAPAIVLFMVYKKVPALPALAIGCFVGAIFTFVFQSDLLTKLEGGELSIAASYQTIITTAYAGFKLDTGNALIDSLFNRGGMSGMLNTVWLILCAMIFGGALEGTGMLQKIASSILSMVRGAGSLVGATLASCIFTNLTACDQYLAIVVPGRMFKKAYDDFGLHPKNLSRALEDSGTVTSVLIPWNSGGAYNAGVLGVATLTYMPYCFFNFLSPVVSAFLAGMNLTIEKKDA